MSEWQAQERCFSIVVKKLAGYVRNGTVPDPEEFEAYLVGNPVLAAEIETFQRERGVPCPAGGQGQGEARAGRREGGCVEVKAEKEARLKDQHPRLYNIVVENLSILVYDQHLPDLEDFAHYLSQHRILDTAIKSSNDEYEAHLRRQAAYQRTQVYYTEQTAIWKARADKEAALERSVQDKMKKSSKQRKFTKEEIEYFVRRYKKQPPKGCWVLEGFEHRD